MGIFSHLVEATARDINQLLKLQKVHPQVRDDVKRYLDALIQKSYKEVFNIPEHQKESTFQICNSLVNEIVNTCLTIDIPRADFLATEKKCTDLEERLQNMEGLIKYYESYQDDLKLLLDDIKSSHYYMLHSYFREVLILRRRIDYLKKKNHRDDLFKFSNVSGKTLLPSTGDLRSSSRKSMVFHSKESTLVPDLTSESEKIDQQPKIPFPNLTSNSNSSILANDLISLNTSRPIRNSESLHRSTQVTIQDQQTVLDECSPLRHNTPRYTHENDFACSSSRKSKTETLDLGGTDDPSHTISERISSNHFKISDLGQLLEHISKTEEPVDAIFDYEEYVGLLNKSHYLFEERIGKLLSEKEKAKYYYINLHLGTISDNSFGFSSETTKLLQNQLKSQHNAVLAYQRNLHMAIDLIKGQFFEILEQLRNDISRLQQQYENQMSLVFQVFLLQQSRSNALADCFTSFMHDVSLYLENISKSIECKRCYDFFKIPPGKVHHLTDLLKQPTEAKYSLKLRELQSKVDEPPNLDYSFLWGIHFYVNNSIIKEAESLLRGFSKRSTKLQRHLKNLLLQNVLLSAEKLNAIANSNRPMTVSESGAEPTAKEKHELWNKTKLENTGGMTGKDLLKELVSLRLRRAANRVCLSRFESMIKAEEDADKIKLYKAMCYGLKHQLTKDTARIIDLLRLLYLSLHEVGIKPSFQILAPKVARGVTRNLAKHSQKKETYYSIVDGSAGLDADGNCIYFNDERIPISFFNNDNNPRKTYTRGEVSAAFSGDYEYYTGVQLGRPVKEGMHPLHYYHNEELHACFEPLMRKATASAEANTINDPSMEGHPSPNPEPMPMTRIVYPGFPPPAGPGVYYYMDGYPLRPPLASPCPSSPNTQGEADSPGSMFDAAPPLSSPVFATSPRSPASRLVLYEGPGPAPCPIAAPVPLFTPFQTFLSHNGPPAGARMAYWCESPYLYSLDEGIYPPPVEEEPLLWIRPLYPSQEAGPGPECDASLHPREMSTTAVMHDPHADAPPSPDSGSGAAVKGSALHPLKPEPTLPISAQTTEVPIYSTILKAKQMRAARIEREAALKLELQKQQEAERSLKEKLLNPAENEDYLRLEIPRLPPLLPKPQQAAQLQRDQIWSIFHTKK
ncbi:unnamed protein product [Phytomonas sp. Hart1]|nr:unnamed protein product [Phytomonas sp. Hart1]|eukprot:CCW71470.1 unnamed protein product [Phytomonas sp. isolate Hart1]